MYIGKVFASRYSMWARQAAMNYCWPKCRQ